MKGEHVDSSLQGMQGAPPRAGTRDTREKAVLLLGPVQGQS
jgi:hypothetical protein